MPLTITANSKHMQQAEHICDRVAFFVVKGTSQKVPRSGRTCPIPTSQKNAEIQLHLCYWNTMQTI